ncbi:TetR family transcriptional regulator [Xinfangfangia sp. D13-10-4-6]|nr:TetR family transcriptional regulator [Pseudogemmobacter hezensis]
MKTARAPRRSRIQQKNRETILSAALEVFSAHGFRGATLDEIAQVAGLSKPNLLYYFSSKEEIYRDLLTGLMAAWLEPLRAMREEGDPLAEIMGYMRRKLDLSRDFPRESRLFATEIIQGAPRINEVIRHELHDLVQDKATVLRRWMDQGRLRRSDPVHLIISVWALTQHYADFEAQTRSVLGADQDPWTGGAAFLETLYLRLLAPLNPG